MSENSGTCKLCGRKLAWRNLTGQCFFHTVSPLTDTATRDDRVPPVKIGGVWRQMDRTRREFIQSVKD